MELGLYTFGDITADPSTGRAIGVQQRYAEILAAAKLADDACHRPFFVVAGDQNRDAAAGGTELGKALELHAAHFLSQYLASHDSKLGCTV